MADDLDDAAVRLEDLASRGGRTRANGGRRGGKAGGAAGAQSRDMLVSKALSTLLRHQAGNAGVELDAEGFARLDQVLLWPRIRSLKPSFAEIQHAVTDNAKQRFSMKPAPGSSDHPESTDPADWLIRANQGHSIKLESEGLHTPITLEAGNIPDIVVHGTYFAFWPLIVESGGLKRMGRTHVHFGTGLPEDNGTAAVGGKAQVHDVGDEEAAAATTPEKGQGRPKVISGMRSDAEIMVFVDVAKSLEAGDMKWWLSSNGVVLTEGDSTGVVPAKYFKEVRGRRQGVGELWKNGEKVTDLPAGVLARIPQGKRGQVGGDGEGADGVEGGVRDGSSLVSG